MAQKQSPETPGDTKTPSSDHARILVAEDDKEMRTLLSVVLRQHGYEVVEVPDGVELLQKLAPFASDSHGDNFDLVISDIRLPGVAGLTVLEGLSQEQVLQPMILITAFGDKETHERAHRLGAPIFDKPFDIAILLDKVREMLSKQSLRNSRRHP
jgi:DNA-binding response OmpR family regulator